MSDVLDRLKTAERTAAEKFTGGVAVVSRQIIVDAIDEIKRLRDSMESKHQLYNIVCEEAERLRDELTGVTDTAYAEIERLRLERERLFDLIRRYAPSLQRLAAECICRCGELAARVEVVE